MGDTNGNGADDPEADERTPLTSASPRRPAPPARARSSALPVVLVVGLVALILAATRLVRGPVELGSDERSVDPTIHAAIGPLPPLSEARTSPLQLGRGVGPILVTGGAGFVGFHLSQRLASEGHKVVVLDDFNPYYSTQLKRDRAAQLQSKVRCEAGVRGPPRHRALPRRVRRSTVVYRWRCARWAARACARDMPAVPAAPRALARVGRCLTPLPSPGRPRSVRPRSVLPQKTARQYAHMITIVEGDLCDGTNLRALFTRHRFSHAVNLAAQAGVRYSLQQPMSYVRANVHCFVQLLEAVRQHPDTRLVFASSSSVYGANKLSPFSERSRVDTPNSLYAATKKVSKEEGLEQTARSAPSARQPSAPSLLAARLRPARRAGRALTRALHHPPAPPSRQSNEAMALVYHELYNISCAGLRFFTVYGPWGRPDMAYFSFAHRMQHGLPIQVKAAAGAQPVAVAARARASARRSSAPPHPRTPASVRPTCPASAAPWRRPAGVRARQAAARLHLRGRHRDRHPGRDGPVPPLLRGAQPGQQRAGRPARLHTHTRERAQAHRRPQLHRHGAGRRARASGARPGCGHPRAHRPADPRA